MKYKLVIQCDNAAFGNNPMIEIARMLEEEAFKLKYNADPYCTDWQNSLRDVNGNKVGASGFIDE